MADNNLHNLIIIGSGPAGYTAALYAARASLAPLQFEGAAPNLVGGQLMITTDVENYPGFPKGIEGPELMVLFREQAARFGTVMKQQNVDKVDFSQRPFKLWSEGVEYQAKAVIIATGANAKWLEIPSEKDFMGSGVSACATCDGAFFKGKELLIVGGGDTAMEEATFLTRFSPKVTLVHRRDTFRASKIMLERVKKNPKITIITNAVVDEIIGEKGKAVHGVRLKHTQTGVTWNYGVQGVFVAIGHEPTTKIFKGQVEMNEVGYITVKQHLTYTSVDGVFTAGDCADHRYRQAVTAAGTGCAAAIDAERWLEANH
jgi:thioredoxin reductase (NADPH)